MVLGRARQALLVAVIACEFISLRVAAQTPSEHESHHPGQPTNAPGTASMAPANPPDMSGNSSSSSTMGMGMQGMEAESGMESMGMGAQKSRELYPALMQLQGLTAQSRAEVERMARERMNSGTSLISSGLEKLQEAASTEDFGRMQDATAQMRQGVEQFHSGVSVLRAASEGQAPRTIALAWFRDSMQLPAADAARPHGIFGLSAFHYFSMLLLLVTVAELLWMNFRKMQRSAALVSKLAAGAQTASLPALAGTPPLPTSLPTQESSSKPNSWTGLLRVVRIFEESPNVSTLRLADFAGGEIPFRHLPGQFVTFTVRPIDQTIKRSYTIASSPTRRDYLEVTVKREEHGTVSSFLHGVHEGDTLQVTGPSGTFTFIGEGANSIVLVSGGVGVTPMMSVLRYLTDRSWSGEVFFIYGCRTDKDVIYREELEYLQRRYPNLRLTIAADEASADWPYARGHITAELLAHAVPHIQTRRLHLCGPPGMMTAVKATLAQMGVPAEQIKTEVFIGRERPTPSGPGASALQPVVVAEAIPAQVAPAEPNVPAQTPALAVITFARSRQTALLAPNKTVLEASEDVGVNIEYSCRVGVCGLCKVKLLSGSVTMDVQEGLDANDKLNNVILACQAKSTADLSVDA